MEGGWRRLGVENVAAEEPVGEEEKRVDSKREARVPGEGQGKGWQGAMRTLQRTPCL